MNAADKKTSDAYGVVREPILDTQDPKAQAARLRAHHTILKFGMHGAGEIARQMQIAEAIADLCLAQAIRLERAG